MPEGESSNADKPVLVVKDLHVRGSTGVLIRDVCIKLNHGEALAITGPSGSGKTSLGLALAGKSVFSGHIEWNLPPASRLCWVEQQAHHLTRQHTSDLYYQQRFNSWDTEETETVAEALGEQLNEAGPLLDEMKISYLLSENLIQLSSGENKKLQLLRARLEKPAVLIMDQPFTGLDTSTRQWLNEEFCRLKKSGMLLLLICPADEIPPVADKVLVLDNGKQESFLSRETYLERINEMPGNRQEAVNNPEQEIETDPAGETVIEMKNVTVCYGQKKILDAVNWTVRQGECWLLTGPNGAGKSTLLSLITADNPQGYANEIYLFGKKRGSGESIWDIKKKTGYLSPELHLYFSLSATAFEAVASGLFDTIGLFRSVSSTDREWVLQWMQVCGVAHVQDRHLYTLPAGEQRLVLLARALVKDPPLLVLDEPCQGLDAEQKKRLLELVDQVCRLSGKTLLFVSHYEKEIPGCIRHYLRLEKGRVQL